MSVDRISMIFLARWICLSAAAMLLGGCTEPWSKANNDSRVVMAEPGRNTRAAKRANETGLEHLQEGELEAAAEDFQRALDADIEFGPAHNHLGIVFYRLGRLHDAAWQFEDAVRLMPNHAEPRNNLGLVLETGATRLRIPGRLDEAIEQYRQAVALDPDHPEYKANLARALVLKGERTEEMRDLLRQVALNDPRPEWRDWAQEQLVNLSGF